MNKLFLIGVFLFILPFVMGVDGDLLDTASLSSCGSIASLSDMEISREYDTLYIGYNAGGLNRIAITDFTDTSALDLISCTNYGSDTVKKILPIPKIAGSDPQAGYIWSAGSSSIDFSVFNATSNGQTLTHWKKFGTGSEDVEQAFPNSLTGYVARSNQGFEVDIFENDETATINYSATFQEDYFAHNGLRDNANTYIFTFRVNSSGFGDVVVVKNLANEIDDITGFNVSSVGFSNDFLEFSNPYLSLVKGTNNITLMSFTPDSLSISSEFGTTGFNYISSKIVGDTLFALAKDVSLNGYIETWDISGSPTLNNTINVTNVTGNRLSTGFIDYSFPTIFVSSSQSPDGMFLYSFEYTAGVDPADNKKPRAGDIQGEASINRNQSFQYTWDIANPETTTLNEKVLTIGNCDYQETILRNLTFGTEFNFSQSCSGSYNIGVINGFDFGDGVNISTCSQDFFTADASTDENLIISMDFYSNDGNGRTVFEFVEFDTSTIRTFIAEFSDGMFNLSDIDGNILLNDVNSTLASGFAPIRVFFQIDPQTDNSNIENKIFTATNYFSRADTEDINNVYCDDQEFCYIGNMATSFSPINNFYGVVFDSFNTTGSIGFDNFQIRTTAEYPLMSEQTSLTGSATCSYASSGTARIRGYLSDETRGHNYLYRFDKDVSISQTSIGAGDALAPDSLVNILTDLAGTGGFSDDASLALLSIIFIMSIVTGTFMLTSGSASAGTFTGILATILFWYLGWMPTAGMVIVVLIGSAIIALSSSVIIGGG